jgi:hypothetical protein
MNNEEKIEKINKDIAQMELLNELFTEVCNLYARSADVVQSLGYLNCKGDVLRLMANKIKKP